MTLCSSVSGVFIYMYKEVYGPRERKMTSIEMIRGDRERETDGDRDAERGRDRLIEIERRREREGERAKTR